MIRALRWLFGFIFLGMIGITVWASLQKNILDCWPGIVAEPWAIATLADAYCGFLTFFAWVFYKEARPLPRLTWFVLIMGLGNIAMSFYMLMILFRLPVDATAKDILLRRAV